MSSLILVIFIALGLAIAAPAQADDSEGELQCTMITFVAPVKPISDPLLTKETLNHYLPATVLTPTTDSSRVASQVEQSIESKLAEDFSKSDMFRKSSLGQTTTQLETLSQKSVAVSSKAKVEFKVKVVERQAVITYQGALKSEVIYTVGQGTIKWVLSRHLDKTTEIAFTNAIGTDGSNGSSILSLNHSF
jgi:hypothetical protein